jgi:predicted HNH restriction endonuclease
MPYKDPEVRKAYHKEQGRKYYLANKDKVMALSKVNRAVGKARWDTFKRTLKCTKCEQNHPAALDFHHTDPSEKENIVSNLISSGRFAAAMEEVQKCIVLCANCHRIHHYEENSAKIQPLTTNLLPEHAGQR